MRRAFSYDECLRTPSTAALALAQEGYILVSPSPHPIITPIITQPTNRPAQVHLHNAGATCELWRAHDAGYRRSPA
jgi:hypothetical protein